MENQDLASSMTSFEGTEGKVDAYLTRPKAAGNEPRPAVVVIHAIFGLVDHIKNVADRFASQGYVALAPDLFSSGDLRTRLTRQNIEATRKFWSTLPVPKMRDQAFVQQELAKFPDPEMRNTIQKTMGILFGDGLPKDRLTKDLVASVEFLNGKEFVQSGKIGSVGFCFGGGMSLNLGCEGRTAATVVFYGPNPSPIERVKDIAGPVLGLYGGEDMRINADLDKLVKVMSEFKKDYEMRIYPGAPHEFFNDTSPHTYRQAAAIEAWDRVLRFYSRTLGPA